MNRVDVAGKADALDLMNHHGKGEIKDLEPDIRRRIRQEKAAPVMDALHAWMVAQRDLVHVGSAIGKHWITA